MLQTGSECGVSSVVWCGVSSVVWCGVSSVVWCVMLRNVHIASHLRGVSDWYGV